MKSIANPEYPKAFERTIEGKRWLFTDGTDTGFASASFPISAIVIVRPDYRNPGNSKIRVRGEDGYFCVATQFLPADLRHPV